MKYINEKVAYLKGLCDGLEVDDSSKEGKVLVKIVEILEDMTNALEGIGDAYDDLEDYVELIDEDLMEVEDEVYGLEMFDEDDTDDYYEINCPNCGEDFITDYEELEDDDFEVECPSCGYIVEIDTSEYDCECEGDCDCDE
ncbi:MAG: CD1247 N-terminal domain-containing protein [Eubacteriales bacterium]